MVFRQRMPNCICHGRAGFAHQREALLSLGAQAALCIAHFSGSEDGLRISRSALSHG
jgi:hypothetical protein